MLRRVSGDRSFDSRSLMQPRIHRLDCLRVGKDKRSASSHREKQRDEKRETVGQGDGLHAKVCSCTQASTEGSYDKDFNEKRCHFLVLKADSRYKLEKGISVSAVETIIFTFQPN